MTGQSLPLLSCHLMRGAHPEHATRALSWGGAVRRMPSSRTLGSADTVIFAGAILPPTVHLAMSGVCGFHSWSRGCMLLASGGWGPGMLPSVLQRTSRPPCRAALLRRLQLCRGRELALSVLRANLVHLGRQLRGRAVSPAELMASGREFGGPKAGRVVGWTVPGPCSQVWGIRVTSRLCCLVQVCLGLPVRFLIPATRCPLHRTGTHQENSESRGGDRVRGLEVPCLESVRAGLNPGSGQVPQIPSNTSWGELGGAVGPVTGTEYSAGVTQLPRRCPR